MAVETDTERDAMLEDFGVTVTVGANTFTAIFDNEYVESLDIDGTAPVLYCKSSDVSALSIARDTALTVDGNSYQVKGEEPDGTGFTRLILEAQ